MIPVGFMIDETGLPALEAEWLEALRQKCPPGAPLIVICDTQVAVAGCKADGMPCIAYDLVGRLHHEWILTSFEGADWDYIEKAYCRQLGLPLRILETERTYLREFAPDDLDALFALYASPHTTDYIDPLYEYEEERVYEEQYIKNIYGLYDYGMWLVCDRNTDEVIGRAGIEPRSELPGDEAEMGYIITASRRGQGLAAEVCSAIIEWVRMNLYVSVISCRVHPDNLASQGLLKKLGFSRDTANDDSQIRYVLRL